MFIYIYRFLVGFLKISVKGEFVERLLNLFAVNNITIWEIIQRENKLTFYIKIKDFKNIRRIKNNNKIRIKILKKVGLPFYLNRYKARYGLAVGFVVFMLILKILGLFVWDIEIIGNVQNTDAVLKQCAELNIKNGSLTTSLDLPILKEQLLLKSNNLAWGSINAEGSRITINVTEIKNNREEKQPANIIAVCDGIIKKISVSSGQAEVLIGQPVIKGQILISGTVEGFNNTDFVQADGEILAEITETFTFTENYIQKIKTPDYSDKKYVLDFFNLKVPLYLGQNFGFESTEYKVSQLKLFGKNMPIKIHCRKFNYIKEVESIFSREALIIKTHDLFDEQLKKQQIGEFETISTVITDSEEGITINYTIRYLKSIGMREKLLF